MGGGGNQTTVTVVLLAGAIATLLVSFLQFYAAAFMASVPMSFEGAVTTVITALLCYFLPAWGHTDSKPPSSPPNP